MSDVPQQINWPERAAALVHRLGASSIEPSVADCLQAEAPCDVLVACSGGADSVSMLCVFAVRAQELGLRLHLAHYNHRWRGEESDADASFVASLAESFGLPYTSGVRPENEAAFTETTARALRLDFLRRSAADRDCRFILFGHQLDDIIETQLQRIARGCASDGLAAPRPIARFEGLPTHLRPMLHLRAGDIRMALNSVSIPWREDLSNDDMSIARNALRKQIIPELSEALGRDASFGAARSRRLLEEDAAALNQFAREILPEAFAHDTMLSRTRLRAVPVALLRRALAEWLSRHGLIASVSAPAMDVLIDNIMSSRKYFKMSAGEDFIRMEGDRLCLERRMDFASEEVLQASKLEVDESVFLSTGAVIQCERIAIDGELRDRLASGKINPHREAILADPGDPNLEIRAWQPGDRFHPMGAPGRKKVKDWFIDRRVPQVERKSLPLVLISSGEVIWIPGFPPAERYKIAPSTKQALRLTYQSRKPL